MKEPQQTSKPEKHLDLIFVLPKAGIPNTEKANDRIGRVVSALANTNETHGKEETNM